MIGLIQIFVMVFGLFAFSRAVLRFRGGSIKLGELLFWAGVWILGILFALFPGILNWFSSVGGFIRGMDFVVASSIIILFYLMFRLYVKLDELDQTITKLVREIAISKAKK
jgi:small membrane protein